jgi:hypothetical protein
MRLSYDDVIRSRISMIREILGRYLPNNGLVTDRVMKELGKLDPGAVATLIEGFGRRCGDRHLPREDKPVPLGKGKALAETRVSYDRCEYRLVYMIVRPARQLSGSTKMVAVSARPIRFVGVLPIKKKQVKLGFYGKTAWARSEAWLAENPGYERV